MKYTKTQKLVLCALFAALTAVLSQIAIPIGPVPVNLATFSVFCAGAFLGPRLGPVSLLVWMALGVVGVPVFTMFRGGPGVLLGPTGGYIIGYVLAAFLIGLITHRYNRAHKIHLYFLAMLAGSVTYFTLGTIWYMILTQTGLAATLMICVLPFIPGDLLKMAGAAFLLKRLQRFSKR